MGLDARVSPLREFVRTFWPVVEPAVPFKDSWHIGAVCEFLEAWYAREFRNGVISIAPGTGKSLLCDTFFDAWVWSIEPSHRFLHCAFDVDLTLRDARHVEQITQSELYQRCWPETRMRDSVQARSDLYTTQGGFRLGTSPGGKGMGRHVHSVSINDPVKPQDVLDGRTQDVLSGLEKANRWIDGTMPTRRADPARFGVMITMQRLLERDPAGIALSRGYEHLCLPMRFVPREQATWVIGDWTWKLDERTQAGELLHPARYPEHVVREMETALGEHASAQLQQNPIPRTGGLLEESHLRFEWVEPAKPLDRAGSPVSGGYWIQTWDFAAKGTEATHSAVSGQLWCQADVDTVNEIANTLAERDRGAQPVKVLRAVAKGMHLLQIDDVWGIWDVTESETQFERMQSQPLWAKSAQIIVEAKAAGIGVIQRFQRRFPKLIAFHEVNDNCKALAQLDKLDRHRANIGEYHAGRVLLRPWARTVPDKIDRSDGRGPDATRRELLSFPRGARDDRVDSASMALARLCQGQVSRWAMLRALVESPPDV